MYYVDHILILKNITIKGKSNVQKVESAFEIA